MLTLHRPQGQFLTLAAVKIHDRPLEPGHDQISRPPPDHRLDWPFNADPPELYCPRTLEFVYLRDDLRERLEATRARLVAAGADPDDQVDIEVLLEHTPLGEVPMVYELRTSGMACGPVSHRLWVGFDLA